MPQAAWDSRRVAMSWWVRMGCLGRGLCVRLWVATMARGAMCMESVPASVSSTYSSAGYYKSRPHLAQRGGDDREGG
jgi:hypothetical protein